MQVSTEARNGVGPPEDGVLVAVSHRTLLMGAELGPLHGQCALLTISPTLLGH